MGGGGGGGGGDTQEASVTLFGRSPVVHKNAEITKRHHERRDKTSRSPSSSYKSIRKSPVCFSIEAFLVDTMGRLDKGGQGSFTRIRPLGRQLAYPPRRIVPIQGGKLPIPLTALSGDVRVRHREFNNLSLPSLLVCYNC